MIVTRKALSRRTVLRGVGAAVALPLLDAMVPALSPVARTAARPVKRLGFIYIPNGVAMNKDVNYWTPAQDGTGFELSQILAPLEPFRDRLTVISGLRQQNADALGDGNGEHTRATAAWLTGAHPKKTEGPDIQAGTSADQIAAAAIGKDVPLPSLELAAFDIDGVVVGDCDPGYSCTYVATMSWRTPTTPMPTISNPRLVFERLFGEGGTEAQRLDRLQKQRSILDWVREDLGELTRTVGARDRQRIEEYLDAVRDIEQRIQATERQASQSTLPEVLERPLGVPERFEDHVNLMFDLQWLAFQADLTRVVTFMLGKEQNTKTFPEIGVGEPWHPVSHHQDNPVQIAKLAKINTYQTGLYARFLGKLASTPDGDGGTLLDQTLYLYGAGLGNPNLHLHVDLPLTLVGGTRGDFKGGQHVRFPGETPMTNLLLSMLEEAGVSEEVLGDSTGRLPVDL
ncbi:MAG: DUF1552 domain-containing protein [Acidimicrobiia bacterium]|nr:DUF1552 domain-containing protein [Acidimicrobiia bacterium]